MSKYPKHTPARIFLVMGDEDVTKEDDFLELDEITWSSEKVFRTDIEYVRKDLYDALKRKLEKAEATPHIYSNIIHFVLMEDLI